jgi:hypothetical protein
MSKNISGPMQSTNTTVLSSSFISGIEITYGTALGPTSYSRLIQTHNTAAIGKPPVFLWLARGDDKRIESVIILYDEEVVPFGYIRIPRDLSGGSSSPIFLAYKEEDDDNISSNQSLKKYLANIRILSEEEEVEPEYVILEKSITRSSPYLRLALLYTNDNINSSTWTESLKIGDICDVQDKSRHWRVAKVIEISSDGSKLTFSFKGWSSRHDEEIIRQSRRIARPGTYTAGKDTRAVRKQGDVFSIDLEFLKSLEMRIDDFINGEFPLEEQVGERTKKILFLSENFMISTFRGAAFGSFFFFFFFKDSFFKGDLPSVIEAVLSSKYDNEALRDRINVCIHCFIS